MEEGLGRKAEAGRRRDAGRERQGLGSSCCFPLWQGVWACRSKTGCEVGSVLWSRGLQLMGGRRDGVGPGILCRETAGAGRGSERAKRVGR